MANKSKEFISEVYNFFINLIDNPVTQAIAFALLVIPLYFYFIFPLTDATYTALDLDAIQEVAQWISFLNGIFFAMILPNVWAKLDAVETEFDREVTIIKTLHNSLLSISNKPKRKALVKLLRLYVEHVQNHYLIENIDLVFQQKGIAILQRLRDCFLTLFCHRAHREL